MKRSEAPQAFTTFSILTLIGVIVAARPVLAAKNSYALGSRWDPPEGEDLKLCEEVCDHIVYRSQQMGFTSYDWYGSSTTKRNILLAASGGSAFNAISFYIGHGDYLEYCIIVADDGTQVSDPEIYDETVDRITKFAFLWSCWQAVMKERMPKAWMHTEDMSDDGYHYPDDKGYVYIGFRGPTPPLNTTIDDVATAGFKFVKVVYDAFSWNYPVTGALDMASKFLWDEAWDECLLHTNWQMWVYGDGTLFPSMLEG